MYKLLTSKGQLLAIVIGILGVAISLGSIISGVKSNYTMGTDLNAVLKDNAGANFDFFDPAISVVIFLIVIAIVAAVVFGLIGIITNPKASMKGIIGLALVAILFAVLYSSAEMGGTSKIISLIEKNNISDSISKMISGGVMTAVVAALIAVAAAVIMEILNLFK